ncbi:MAG TPA: hypothetical protein VF337_02300 [Candidatus Limnocylindrales bacterium]
MRSVHDGHGIHLAAILAQDRRHLLLRQSPVPIGGFDRGDDLDVAPVDGGLQDLPDARRN